MDNLVGLDRALRSALLAALRQAHKARRPRARRPDRRGPIPHMTPSAERPAEVATRTGTRPLGSDLSRAPAMARPSAPWWSGRRAWSSWHEWRGRMHGVPDVATRSPSSDSSPTAWRSHCPTGRSRPPERSDRAVPPVMGCHAPPAIAESGPGRGCSTSGHGSFGA